MKPPKDFLILIGKQSLYFGEGRHKDTRNLQKGEVKGTDIELYIADLLRRILNLRIQNDLLTREDISRLGQMLYSFIKEYNLDVAFRRFYRDIAGAGGDSPFGRIFLEFDADATPLAILPWEFLSYGEPDNLFLGAHKDFKFDLIRRYSFHADQGVFSYSPKPDASEKVNILLIHSEPTGFPFGGEKMVEWFESLYTDQKIGLKIISQPTFDQFSDQLKTLAQEGFLPDIIHFAGNGEIHGDKGFVGFVDPADDRKIDWVEDQKFLDFLAPVMGKVKLAFLQTCNGGVIGDYASRNGLGMKMLGLKIPALVAMQAPVMPLVALDFARVFYESVLNGEDVARAVTSGRKKLCFELQKEGAGDPFEKRVNPYGDKSFGIPLLYITTEEPFPLVVQGGTEKGKDQSAGAPVIYICQNKGNPQRCPNLRMVDPDQLECPFCNGPLVPEQRVATSPGGQSARVSLPGKSKAGKSPGGEAFLMPLQGEEKKKESNDLVILFLAANPKDTSRLRLDEEASRIEKALQRSAFRDRLKLVHKMAVQIPDLRRALLDTAPGIVHFSGHGSDLGRIYLEDPTGHAQEVSAEALGNFLRIFREHIRVVILNACYSELQAEEIVKHGIPVIGMRSSVPDKAGVEFSEAFYDALGAGKSLDFAFELGCSAIEMYDLKEDIPVLLKPEN